MSIKSLNFEGLMLRSKVPIPFVEEGFLLPRRVLVDGYFPSGTVFKYHRAVCSQKLDAHGEPANDYCHAVALEYNSRYNGGSEGEKEEVVYFHVDLSALFLILDPIDENGQVIEL